MHRAELVGHDGEQATFDIECSSGTYVRQLVAALGDAYCAELRRTAIGPFSVEDADPGAVLAPARALAFMPERELDAEQARLVAHGVKLTLDEGDDVALARAADARRRAGRRGRAAGPAAARPS